MLRKFRFVPAEGLIIHVDHAGFICRDFCRNSSHEIKTIVIVKYVEGSNNINAPILLSALKLVYDYILVYMKVHSASKYDG